MDKIYRSLTLTANALIIVVALFMASILTKEHSLSRTASLSGRNLPKVGDKVALNTIDWAKSKKNVLLVLQKGCHFCAESAGFYQKLVLHTRDKQVNIVAVLPQEKREAEKYVEDLGISGVTVTQSRLDSLLIAGTPTIIVADDHGQISSVWLGKLSQKEEDEVLATLSG